MNISDVNIINIGFVLFYWVMSANGSVLSLQVLKATRQETDRKNDVHPGRKVHAGPDQTVQQVRFTGRRQGSPEQEGGEGSAPERVLPLHRCESLFFFLMFLHFSVLKLPD